MKRIAIFVPVVAYSALTLTLATSPGAASGATSPGQRVIVMLKDSSRSPADVASLHARTHGARIEQTYDTAMRGYAASVPGNQVAALRADPQVAAVIPDHIFRLRPKPLPFPPFDQLVPYGIERVGATVSSTRAGDGHGRVNADIAVIDTGAGPQSDLDIAGGINCSGEGAPWDLSDNDAVFGHGTHVAGIAAAKDNGSFYVGVAPGARVWVVKIFDSTGAATLGNVLCGLEWVARHAAFIDVVNFSASDTDSPFVDDHNCGLTVGDPEHFAICTIVRRGVTFVTAAGNDDVDAARVIPAAYDEVITVSAIADTDGIPGGLDRDGRESNPVCAPERDDTRATFSNYGADVDITAPGVCVSSLSQVSPGARQLSGTSQAAPHVAGAVALYRSRHRFASPAQVKAALLKNGSYAYDDSSDPDVTKEPLLDVSKF